MKRVIFSLLTICVINACTRTDESLQPTENQNQLYVDSGKWGQPITDIPWNDIKSYWGNVPVKLINIPKEQLNLKTGNPNDFFEINIKNIQQPENVDLMSTDTESNFRIKIKNSTLLSFYPKSKVADNDSYYLRGIIFKLPNENKHGIIAYFSDKNLPDDSSEINSLLNNLSLLKKARVQGPGPLVKLPSPE